MSGWTWACFATLAAARPEWHLVMLGPCVKIDPSRLPHADNIHYLGMKTYNELPSYLAGWDVALLPFARNESTRFISPTKTPEYLAAGCPVVSTPVRDVVRPYGDRGFVAIAESAGAFVAAIERALAGHSSEWREEVDRFLSQMSWDRTWTEMCGLIDGIDGLAGRSSTIVQPIPFAGCEDTRPESPLSTVQTHP